MEEWSGLVYAYMPAEKLCDGVQVLIMICNNDNG